MTRTKLWACTGLALALAMGCGDDDRPAVDAGPGDGGEMDAGPPGCPTGTMLCGDTCVDTQNSRANCGACGTACAAGEACVDGACDVLCPSTQTECDGACADTMTDRNHCGACGTPCAVGEICVDGACALSCPAGQEVCGAECADTQSSPAHCGACDAACTEGQVCSEGTCTTSCAAGLTECGGACVDEQNNPLHCGACDAACTAPAGASGLCMAGTCRTACDPLQGDCNADLGATGSDGCETPLSTDPSNCGACGLVCTAPNAVSGCTTGMCTITSCDTGFDDCDGLIANGCESDVTDDAFNCGACGTVCSTGDSCVDGVCTTLVGDTCANAVTLTAGVNTIAWTAFGAEYLTSTPSCASGFSLDGPDLVLSYTATAAASVAFDFTKPTSTRWAAVFSTGACGTLTPEAACLSEFSDPFLRTTVSLAAGETVYIYLIDTTSGSNPLDNPLTVTVSVPTCTPGMGGVVGTTTARVATGLASFTEYYAAVDESPTGYAYVGGTSDLYRIPKAGGTVEDVEVAAGITTSHLGYAMLIDGSNIYVINDSTTGVSGKLWRISSDGGATWSVQDMAFFTTAPEDDFRAATVYGGRIYLVTEEDSTGVPTEIWSVDPTAATLPAVATLELSITDNGDCHGLARDATYYYLVCADTTDAIFRVPVAGGASELITALDISLTNSVLYGDDLDADGTFDVLYMQSDLEESHYTCDPAGASPFTGTLVNFGTGTSNYGMGFDATANVLWQFDDDTREFVTVQ